MSEIAANTEDRSTAELFSLVLWSAGIPHKMTKTEESWQLQVNLENMEEAQRELSEFVEENRNWPPPEHYTKVPLKKSANHKPPTVLLIGTLAIFHAISGPWSAKSDWFSLGAVNTQRIFDHGEWWRCITALTLHADPVHLLGNLFIGGFLVHFLCRTLGTGLGWLLVLLSGAFGNFLNVAVHGPNHHSVGFSTAVFGTIGILTARQGISKHKLSIKEILLPFAAGAALLAFLGTEGENTDLGAHLFGFLAGVPLGLISMIPAIYSYKAPSRNQTTFSAATLTIIFASWYLAWN